jgi:hypothetical protein
VGYGRRSRAGVCLDDVCAEWAPPLWTSPLGVEHTGARARIMGSGAGIEAGWTGRGGGGGVWGEGAWTGNGAWAVERRAGDGGAQPWCRHAPTLRSPLELLGEAGPDGRRRRGGGRGGRRVRGQNRGGHGGGMSGHRVGSRRGLAAIAWGAGAVWRLGYRGGGARRGHGGGATRALGRGEI